MERGSRDPSGAESTSEGGDDEKDKDIDNSYRIHESEDEGQPDSGSVETIPATGTSPRGARDIGSNAVKKTGRYFADLSYLNGLSRQKRRRIEGEMIKGRKPGECKLVTQQ